MAGTLQVNDRSAWTPAGWIYNNILERIALRLESDDTDLANTVFDELGPMPGYLDLCLEPADRVQLFLRAAEEVCRRAEVAGASAFPDVAFYDPFMSELHQLLQSLHADPRVFRQ
jgi:hypothetical protein